MVFHVQTYYFQRTITFYMNYSINIVFYSINGVIWNGLVMEDQLIWEPVLVFSILV